MSDKVAGQQQIYQGMSVRESGEGQEDVSEKCVSEKIGESKRASEIVRELGVSDTKTLKFYIVARTPGASETQTPPVRKRVIFHQTC